MSQYDSCSVTDLVKGTAVNSMWPQQFRERAKAAYGGIEKDGVVFDESSVLLMILPIRFANLKSSDINNVSWLLHSYFVSN